MPTPDDQAPIASTPSKSKKLVTIIAIIVGVIGGGGAGVFMAGPLLAGKLPARTAPAPSDSAASADAQGSHDEKGGAGAIGAPVHLVENMVLNPANSGGARFLLLSVAFAVKNAAVAEAMTARDPELRDVILRDMGARQVEELADITRRDSIKVQLRTAVQKRFGRDAVLDIYFPQFVIQ